MRRVEILAPAKINLYLHMTGRRSDGFHLLDSLVAFTDIGDTLRITATPTSGPGDPRLEFRATGRFAGDLPPDAGDNIVCRAVRMLIAEIPETIQSDHRDIVIELTKSLPVASGIGSGSADAAASLRALMQLGGARGAAGIGTDRLRELALDLGADVPVCLACEPALMRGIGEDLTPSPALPEMGVVLVNPGRALSTQDVFRKFAAQDRSYRQEIELPDSGFGNAGEFVAFLGGQDNDLGPAATLLMPEVGQILAALEASPSCLLARMSGSGATCFGLYKSRREAVVARDRLRDEGPSAWWSEAGGFLAGAPIGR